MRQRRKFITEKQRGLAGYTISAKQGKAVNHIGIYIDAPSRDFAILALSSSAKPGAFDEVTA